MPILESTHNPDDESPTQNSSPESTEIPTPSQPLSDSETSPAAPTQSSTPTEDPTATSSIQDEIEPAPSGESCWHALIVREGEEPELISGGLEDILEPLQELQSERTALQTDVYVFYGLRADFSPAPFRYLLWPGGEFRTPLFELPADDDLPRETKAIFGRQNYLPVGDELVEEEVPALPPSQQSKPIPNRRSQIAPGADFADEWQDDVDFDADDDNDEDT